MVKRYRATGDYAYPCEEDAAGSLVDYDDYAALAERCERLEAMNVRLRNEIRDADDHRHSHKCRRCRYAYTPPRNESEDCPACEYDGTEPIPGETP